MIFDVIFSLIFIFFVAFSWLRFYKYSVLLSALGGILAATLIYKLASVLFGGRRERKKLKLSEKRQAERLAHYLAFAQTEESYKIIETAFKQSGTQYSAENDGFLLIANSKKVLVKMFFSAAPVSADFICRAAREAQTLGATQVNVLCCKSDKCAAEAALSAPVKVKILGGEDCFAFLKKHDALPELPDNVKSSRLVTLSNFGTLFFHRSRAKYYFFSSALLILFSYISIFRLYNLIMGSVLFLMFLYARFNKRFNPPQEQEM